MALRDQTEVEEIRSPASRRVKRIGTSPGVRRGAGKKKEKGIYESILKSTLK